MSEGITLTIKEIRVITEFLSNQWLTRDHEFESLREIIQKMQRAIEAHDKLDR